jgi:predicted DNA-binding transcriptional regulator YafY
MENSLKKLNISRNQLHRLARISSLLQKNAYPTPASLIEEYKDLELYSGLGRGTYCEKTVRRDIQVLKNEFNCPIAYSRKVPGYYLTNHNWSFECPTDLSEHGMLTLIIGAKLVEDIFPSPLKDRVKIAVDEILKWNNPDFLDSACVNSLKIFAESSAHQTPELFSEIFEAWLKHKMIKIGYDDLSGGVTERKVEPHILFLYNREWRIKAWCHLKKGYRTFVVNRIKSVVTLSEFFEPDVKMIEEATLDNIIGYKKIKNVKIRLYEDAYKFAISNTMHTKQTITKDGNSWIFTIPAVPLEVVVPWILSQGGNAIPLEPQLVVDKVKEQTLNLLNQLA